MTVAAVSVVVAVPENDRRFVNDFGQKVTGEGPRSRTTCLPGLLPDEPPTLPAQSRQISVSGLPEPSIVLQIDAQLLAKQDAAAAPANLHWPNKGPEEACRGMWRSKVPGGDFGFRNRVGTLVGGHQKPVQHSGFRDRVDDFAAVGLHW